MRSDMSLTQFVAELKSLQQNFSSALEMDVPFRCEIDCGRLKHHVKMLRIKILTADNLKTKCWIIRDKEFKDLRSELSQIKKDIHETRTKCIDCTSPVPIITPTTMPSKY